MVSHGPAMALTPMPQKPELLKPQLLISWDRC
jgi:hypothetical protein